MALYDTIGRSYASFRRPDARIAAAIHAALGDAKSVVNVGAGTGSYEPTDRQVIAVEPSEVMIQQRPASAAPCLLGSAESLPLDTGSVEAAMAILSAHHWSDLERGLREMARVARRRAVLLTWIPDGPPFWLTQDYFPEIIAYDRTVFPNSTALLTLLQSFSGAAHLVRMTPVAIPHDCTDGMLCSYWRRPELYLEDARRAAMSSFSRINAKPGVEKLRSDLASGAWSRRNAHLLNLEALDAGYRLFCFDTSRSPA